MLDVVESGTAIPRAVVHPDSCGDPGRPELAWLARQTLALECIASQLQALTGLAITLPAELQPDFEIARRRLLEEAI